MTSGPHRKPLFDIYSTMLVIAFVAMVIGTVFAYLETADYKTNKTKGAPPVSMVLPADWPVDTIGPRHFKTHSNNKTIGTDARSNFRLFRLRRCG